MPAAAPFRLVKLRLYSQLVAFFILFSFTIPSQANDRQTVAEQVDQRIRHFESGLRAAFVLAGERPETWTIDERMAQYNVPAVSLVVIENGQIAIAKAYGFADKESATVATVDTAFSVGSVSKMGTAAALLRMAAEGTVNLDEDVNRYLTSWQLPGSPLTEGSPVTLRGILSHSAGLTVSGFPDFLPGEKMPTIYQTLEGQPPARHEPVRVFYKPGSAARYSGGGTTISQLVIQDTSNKLFALAIAELVLEPLGMSRSTYVNPAPYTHEPLAKAYNDNGAPVALPRGWQSFPEAAASGLWTTPTDIAKLYLALTDSYHGTENSFLPQALARKMMTQVGPSHFGLGPQLIGTGVDRRFYHGGSNESYKAFAEMHLERRSGVVIFTNGANGSKLYEEIRRAVADAFGWPFYRPLVLPNVRSAAGYDESISKYEGDYRVNEPLDWDALRIFVVRPLMLSRIYRHGGDSLFVTFPGYDDNSYELRPVSPSRFVVDQYYGSTTDMLQIEFVNTGAKEAPAMILHHHGYSATATRITDTVDSRPAPLRH